MIHKLKNKSSFIVVVLRSLCHRACVRCSKPVKSLDESFDHWKKELAISSEDNATYEQGKYQKKGGKHAN